jgi:hypothetical protein
MVIFFDRTSKAHIYMQTTGGSLNIFMANCVDKNQLFSEITKLTETKIYSTEAEALRTI